MLQYNGYNFIEGLASVWGTLMASTLFLYKCKKEGADRELQWEDSGFGDGLKGPESKTEPTKRTIVVKSCSRAESHLRGEGGCAQAEHQPGLLSWHRNFCTEFQGSSTAKGTTVEQERSQSQHSPGRSVRWQRSELCPAQPAKPAACQPRLSTWPPAPLLH